MKIVFEKIVIENFLSIGSAEIKLNEPGITLVSGINNQDKLSISNGSGKSSIFEAILWCLTGSTSRGSSVVSNIHTGKSASAELHFIADTSYYIIKRTAEPSNLTLSKDGKDISGNTFTKSKKILSDLLNFIDYDMLSSIIILTQGLGGRLSNLKPSERKSRLELFSNLQELLDTVTSSVNNVTNDISEKYAQASKDLAVIESKISSNNKLIDGYNSKINEVKANVDKILSKEEQADLESEIQAAKQRIEQLEDSITAMTIDLNTAVLHKSSLENNLSNYRKEIADIKKNYIAAMNKTCPLCSQPLHDNSIVDKYDQRLEELSGLILKDTECLSNLVVPSREQIDNLEKEKRELVFAVSQKQSILLESAKYNSSIDAWQEMISASEKEIKDLEPSLLPLRTDISVLNKEGLMAKWYKQAIPRKFRNFLLDNVVDYMNKRLEHYSKYLFSDRVVKLVNDGNNLLIKLDNLNFENLSGGEGRRVDLLLQLSLRDLAINQSGFYCNLLVMDEVFDYLDDTGIENFLVMVDKESSFSDSLMVITHRKDVSIPVSQHIVVTKSAEGISSCARVG